MALHLIPSETLRAACRQRLEACELWLRRIIHDQLKKDFGTTYITTAQVAGQAIFRTEIRRHVAGRVAASPARYGREIDALQLDHLAAVICKVEVYRKYFKAAFSAGFPTGSEHLRLVLDRLVQARNSLAHANALTIHDAERALCYSNDIIASLIQYYASIGMSQDFDAPSFTRFSDSIGNQAHPSSTEEYLDFTSKRRLRCGESIRLEVEVDAHYPPSDYDIQWQVANVAKGAPTETGSGASYSLDLIPRYVGTMFSIIITLTSKKEWHRHGNFDARLIVIYTVLPPI